MARPELIVVALGANLGPARDHLMAGLQGLRALPVELGLAVVGVSPLYRSPPWQTQGPDFLNAVVLLQALREQGTDAPMALLRALQAIEAVNGRQRPYRYAPRTLDLDLILFGTRVIETPELQLPHPRALQRAFVLQRLCDLAPALPWPGLAPGAWVDACRALDDPPPQRVEDPAWPLQALSAGQMGA